MDLFFAHSRSRDERDSIHDSTTSADPHNAIPFAPVVTQGSWLEKNGKANLRMHETSWVLTMEDLLEHVAGASSHL